MNNFNFKLPDIASGKVIPNSVKTKVHREEKEKAEQKKQLCQNILINVLCIILGAILGNLPSIINWLNNLLFLK